MTYASSSSCSSSSAIIASLAFGASLLLVEYVRTLKSKWQFEQSYWSERRGRTRVEQEMRHIANVQLKTDEGFFVQHIAEIQSCYRQCVGTPRQGMLVPSSKARLVLKSNMSPEALVGLDEFSHVWLTFKFHLNTNLVKNAKAFEGVVTPDKPNQTYTFAAKITPPMLKRRVGVLSTRSPHRPNPIGVTLAKIVSIDKAARTVHLSHCDLVHGTPVLDIKPYVPSYDTVKDVAIPEWIEETIDTRNNVTFRDNIFGHIEEICEWFDLYKNDAVGFRDGLVETLQAEVRSKFQTNKRISDAEKDLPVDVPFDECDVQYLWKVLDFFFSLFFYVILFRMCTSIGICTYLMISITTIEKRLVVEA